jgi:hypothetical protein
VTRGAGGWPEEYMVFSSARAAAPCVVPVPEPLPRAESGRDFGATRGDDETRVE